MVLKFQDVLNVTRNITTAREFYPKYLDRIVYWFFLLFSASSIISAGLFINNNRRNLADSGIAFVLIMGTASAVIKFTVFVKHRERVQKKLDESFENNLSRFSYLTVKFCEVYFITAILLCLLWYVAPFFGDEVVLPLPYHFPFTYHSDTVFTLCYIYAVLGLANIGVIQLGTDSTYMIISANLYDQVDSLFGHIATLKRYSQMINNNAAMIKVKFDEFIEVHKDCLTFLKELMDKIFLGQLLQSIAMSCFMFLSITQTEDLVVIVKCGGCVIFAFCQLFIICFYGQRISDKFEMIHSLLFWSSWDLCTIEHKKSLLITQGFTVRPFKLVGGSLYEVTFKTFAWAMKESMSYYMFLRTVAKRSKEI